MPPTPPPLPSPPSGDQIIQDVTDIFDALDNLTEDILSPQAITDLISGLDATSPPTLAETIVSAAGISTAADVKAGDISLQEVGKTVQKMTESIEQLNARIVKLEHILKQCEKLFGLPPERFRQIIKEMSDATNNEPE